MVPSLAPGQFPAAVHRWFARGEDWAVHPLLAGRMSEVLAAVDGRMKSREPGPIAATLGAGRLVGELLDDPECLDPRATGRRPIVVRLAYAMGALTARDEDALLSALRRARLPSNPGVDQGLIVSADVRPMVAPAVPSPGPRRTPWKLVAALLSLPLLAALGWRLATTQSDAPSRGETPGKTVGVKEIVPDDLTVLARRYVKIDHPYVRFLTAQPEALKRGRQPGEESYDTWRRRTTHAFTAADHPLPRQLRERVARWREPEPGLAEACERMRELRRKWDPAAQGRPTLIEEPEAFFEALTRPAGLPPREEFDHPGNAFLWRLPRDPVAAGRTFDTEADLRATLGPLVQQLTGAALTPWTSAELVGRVERAMDFRLWQGEQGVRGVVFAEEGPAGAAVEDGLRRFGR